MFSSPDSHSLASFWQRSRSYRGGQERVTVIWWLGSGSQGASARDMEANKSSIWSHGRMSLVSTVIQQSIFPLPYHMPSLTSSNSQWSFFTIGADFFKATSCWMCLVFSIGPMHGNRTSTNSLFLKNTWKSSASCLLDWLLSKEVLLQQECYPGFLPSSSLHWLSSNQSNLQKKKTL